MGNVNRILFTDIEVERFVDGVLEITDIAKKREAINSITAAERNILTYPHFSTWLKQELEMSIFFSLISKTAKKVKN